jgi:hypothetical protein
MTAKTVLHQSKMKDMLAQLREGPVGGHTGVNKTPEKLAILLDALKK